MTLKFIKLIQNIQKVLASMSIICGSMTRHLSIPCPGSNESSQIPNPSCPLEVNPQPNTLPSEARAIE